MSKLTVVIFTILTIFVFFEMSDCQNVPIPTEAILYSNGMNFRTVVYNQVEELHSRLAAMRRYVNEIEAEMLARNMTPTHQQKRVLAFLRMV